MDSRQEAVRAFLDGEIPRRTLVRRLVETGLAPEAARAHAELLTPRWLAQPPPRDAAD